MAKAASVGAMAPADAAFYFGIVLITDEKCGTHEPCSI